MQLFKQYFSFLLYTHIYIAICAVLMVTQTYQLVLSTEVNQPYLFFVFFSTLTSYSFHYYFQNYSVVHANRSFWLSKHQAIKTFIFFSGIIGSVFFFFKLHHHALWIIAAMVATFLYSAPTIPHPIFRALRKVAYGKTIFLAAVWIYVTTILPMIIADAPFDKRDLFFIISRFFLIYSVCILFDNRDREDDKRNHVKSLITFVSERTVVVLLVLSLLIFTGFTISLGWQGFSLLTIIVLLIPGLIIAALVPVSLKSKSDLLYLGLLDGMMAFSSLLTLLIPGI